MESQPLSEDVDADATLRTNEAVQDVVGRLSSQMEGAELDDIMVRLREELEQAGLGEQPAPWMRAATREIHAGRLLVIDARHQVDDEELAE